MNANERKKKIEAIRKQREELRAKMNSLLGKERADENRNLERKIRLIGASVLEESKTNAKVNEWLTNLLNKKLTAASDRAACNLPPMPTTSANGGSSNENATKTT